MLAVLNEFDSDLLKGFSEGMTFAALRADKHRGPPRVRGVYAVVHMFEGDPNFLPKGSGGRFKDRDPNVGLDVLRERWVPGSRVLYIGKAGGRGESTHLHERLGAYSRFGRGGKIAHWGGRLLWQIDRSPELVVRWLATPDEEPRSVEHRLLEAFKARYGRLPFANLAETAEPPDENANKSKQKRSRRHHHVPQMLLRGFTNSDGVLNEIDLQRGRVRLSNTQDVAFINDFHRFRGIADEDVLEKALAKVVEGKAGPALEVVRSGAGTLDHERLAHLLVFVSTLYVRTPSFREWYLTSRAQFAEWWMHARMSTPHLWNKFVAERRAKGDVSVSEEQYERVREMFEPGKMTYKFPSEHHLKAIVDHSEFIFTRLANRKWLLVGAAEGSGGFICSDNPVALWWSFPPGREPDIPPFILPGFDSLHSEVFVPLSHEHGLVGRFGVSPPPTGSRVVASAEAVAVLNTRTLEGARGFVYAKDLDFRWIDIDLAEKSGAMLVDIAKTRAEAKSAHS